MGLLTKTALPSLFSEEALSAESKKYVCHQLNIFQHFSGQLPEEKPDANQGKMTLGFLRS